MGRFCYATELPEQFRIHRIGIEGANALKVKKIRKALTLSPPAFWRIWRQDPLGSEQDLADEADRISSLYKELGFYNTVVSYDVSIRRSIVGDTPSVRVVYAIDEGDPVLVDVVSVAIEENEAAIGDIEALYDTLPLQQGMRFEEKAYRETKKIILKKMGNEGYPFATITGKALIYPGSNGADVTFSVMPGQRCVFGETTITSGKNLVKEKILNRSRTYDAGDLYDTSKVDQSQRNLYNLDVFKAAVIEPGEPDVETGVVPMSLSLKSKKKRKIKLGIGYGEEDGIRAKAGYTYRNPLGWAGRLSFEAQRTDLLNKASTGYNQPFFLDARGALQTEVGVLQEFLDSYDSRELFGDVKYTRDLDHHLDMTLAYLVEYSELIDLNLIDPDEIAAFRDDNTFFSSSVLGEIIRDTSDSQTDPKNGSTITASLEIASTLTGSDLTFVNPSLEFKNYISLPLDIVLATRFRMETITDPEKNETIPVFNRLFLGGANTVRGYGYQKLGPLDASGNPEGGQTSVLANLEFRHPIVGILSGVVFLDGGMVAQRDFTYDYNKMRWSTGAGLRLGTPVGPIRFDFGYKLNPRNTDGGVDKTDRWRIHFSIGQTF